MGAELNMQKYSPMCEDLVHFLPFNSNLVYLLFGNSYTCMRKNYCEKLFLLRRCDFLKLTLLKIYFCFTVSIGRKRSFLTEFLVKDYKVYDVFHNFLHILKVTDESTVTH